MNFEVIINRLKAMPWAGQWRLIAGLALLLIGILALGLWGFTPDYAPLYPSLAEKDSGAVMTALEQNGYSYKLSTNGVLEVERNKVYEARYKLAALGLPKTNQEESSAPPKFGATNSQEQAYQQKLKELELARTIGSISGVGNARVHLALPHQTVFGKETTNPTASVVIETSSGISRSQAAAIAHMVANANPGMKTTDVSIIDSKGRLLTEDAEQSGDTPEQRTYAKELRADFQSRIGHLLEPLVGKDGSKVEIDVSLEFGNEEAVTESWKPNSGDAAIRSQQNSDSRQGSNIASGAPGSATNSLPLSLPPLPGTSTSNSKNDSTGASQNITNYEVDRAVTKSIKKGVKIKKIRAAVLVDYKHITGKDGKITSTPLAADDLAKIQALVQESIGIDEDRGDSLQVLNLQFMEQKAQNDDASLPIWKDPYLVEMALLSLKWLAIIGTLLWLGNTAKKLMNALSVEPEKKNEQISNNDNEESAKTMDPTQEPAFDINAIRTVAQGNPQAVASVIKDWVEGDGNE